MSKGYGSTTYYITRLMSYLRYLCLFASSGVQHILCYVFLFCFVCLFFWGFFFSCLSSSCVPYVVHFWLPLPYSLTFILQKYSLESSFFNVNDDMWTFVLFVHVRCNSVTASGFNIILISCRKMLTTKRFCKNNLRISTRRNTDEFLSLYRMAYIYQ